MYLIQITQLLLTTILVNNAKELRETNTTFLPYTLKSQVNQDAVLEETLQNLVTTSKNVYKTDDKQALSLYEEVDGGDIIKPSEKNNWKRLTTFLSTGPPPPSSSTYHKQDVSYLCKPQLLPYSTSLFGSYNFYLAQTIFLLIHFAVLSYILFGGITLFNRLVSLSQPSVNAIGWVGGDGHFLQK